MTRKHDAIPDNLAAVRARIAHAAAVAGRDPREIRLLAVSKTQSAGAIARARQAGQRAFGESYLQEALEKIAALADGPDLEWHFIGRLQGNKTREVAAHFDWVHAVDRAKIARRLSAQRPAGRGPLQVCLQVNLSGEASKGGVPPETLPDLAREVAGLPGLALRGLMTLPAPETDPGRQRLPFRRLRALRDGLAAEGLTLDTLSMGMSGDLEAAIAEGSTLVRIGTAVFGPRG